MLNVLALLLPLGGLLDPGVQVGLGAGEPVGGLAGQQTPAGGWRDVELGPGLVLELASGRLRGGERGEAGCLGLDGEELWAEPRLMRWSWAGGDGVSRRVVRGAGEGLGGGGASQASEADGGSPGGGGGTHRPRVGEEYLYELGAEGWGYLRVLGVEAGRLRLEVAAGANGGPASSLERRPAALSVEAQPDGHRLVWIAEPDVGYEVLRRILGEGTELSVARLTGGEWLDAGVPAGAAVEYRVRATDGSGGGFGARARSVRQVHPGEWPLALRVGQKLNLLTGAEGSKGAHIEVTHVSMPNVTLRVVGPVELAGVPRPGGALPWELPAPETGAYSDKLRSMNLSGELAFRLTGPELYGRLSLVAQGEGLALRRQLDLHGGRVLPRAPKSSGELAWSGGELRLRLAPTLPNELAATVVVERESNYLTDTWEEAGAFPGDSLELVLPLARGDQGLTRLRLRHRLSWGTASLPGAALPVLLVDRDDSEQVERALDGAISDLGHGEFARRRAARGVLSLLGPLAWDRLQEAMVGGDAEIVASARDLLLDAEADGTQHLEFVLRARAVEMGVRSEPPAGLFAPEPGERAHVLLEAWARAEEWARVLAIGDPADAVRDLAQLLTEAPEVPYALDGEPFVLQARPPLTPVARDWKTIALERGPLGLETMLRTEFPPVDPLVGLARLRLAFDLGSGSARDWRAPGGGADRAELVLRLLDQYAATGESALLRAAEVLVPGARAILGAERELSTLRLGGAAPGASKRRRIELEAPELALLELRLGSLLEEDASYVDLVLPPGDYGDLDGASGRWIEVRVPGLRLLGQGDVRLYAGVRVQDAEGVVLQGLEVHNSAAAALVMLSAGVTALDCELRGNQTVVTLQDSSLELDRCRLLPAGSQGLYALRFSGGSSLRARATRMAAGSLYLGDNGRAYLDRCVLEAGSRALIQAQQAGLFVARDSLLLGSSLGIYGVEQGLLEGVVLRAGQDPFGRGAERVRYCAEHTRYSGVPSGRSAVGEALRDCPARR